MLIKHSKILFVWIIFSSTLLLGSFAYPNSVFGSEPTSNSDNSEKNMTVPEMASLASRCIHVVKNELKNRDMPVAFLFIGKTEKVISAIGGNTTGPNNSSLSIQPNMCDWDDPESRTLR